MENVHRLTDGNKTGSGGHGAVLERAAERSGNYAIKQPYATCDAPAPQATEALSLLAAKLLKNTLVSADQRPPTSTPRPPSTRQRLPVGGCRTPLSDTITRERANHGRVHCQLCDFQATSIKLDMGTKVHVTNAPTPSTDRIVVGTHFQQLFSEQTGTVQ